MPPARKSVKKRSASRAAPPRVGPAVDALAQAAWAEADVALAEALVECDIALSTKSDTVRREALGLLQQALGRAARRRGLARLGRPRALEDYDPALHELAVSAKRAPRRVRIAQAGVTRGSDVLVKARVKAARTKGS